MIANLYSINANNTELNNMYKNQTSSIENRNYKLGLLENQREGIDEEEEE